MTRNPETTEAARTALLARLSRILGEVPVGTLDLLNVLTGPDCAPYTAAVLAVSPAVTEREEGRYDDAQAWKDNYDGLFVRWAECDAERLALKDLVRSLEIRLRIATAPAVTEGERASYHPDPTINAEVVETANEAERADLAAGYPPRMWRCPECGTEHGRGHHLAIGQHRCLHCGYVGAGGVMFGSNPGRSDTSRTPSPAVTAAEDETRLVDPIADWLAYNREFGSSAQCAADLVTHLDGLGWRRPA